MSGLHEAFDEIARDVPTYGDLDRAIVQVEQDRWRHSWAALGVAAVAALIVIACFIAVERHADSAPVTPVPTHTPESPTDTGTTAAIPRSQPRVLSARGVGREGLEVDGEEVPGRWQLTQSRGDVWVAGYFDSVGYSSPALWWGKGTDTHEVPGQRGGVAISQDAHWIVWTRTASSLYGPPVGTPRVMEVVDTSTGEVRWSRPADGDEPEIGALTVTNDGVVVFAHCSDQFTDEIGTPQCNAATLEVWDPRSNVTRDFPAAVTSHPGPPGTIPALTTEVLVTGAHHGLLVRDQPSDRPRYVHLSAHGEVEVVATLPRSTVAVTADEQFALLGNPCSEDEDVLCEWSALPLDGGESARPIPSLATILPGIRTDVDMPVYPYVVEHDDLIVVRDVGDYNHFPPLARCSLSQARCVRIQD